jgi:hypothetical protein
MTLQRLQLEAQPQAHQLSLTVVLHQTGYLLRQMHYLLARLNLLTHLQLQTEMV